MSECRTGYGRGGPRSLPNAFSTAASSSLRSPGAKRPWCNVAAPLTRKASSGADCSTARATATAPATLLRMTKTEAPARAAATARAAITAASSITGQASKATCFPVLRLTPAAGSSARIGSQALPERAG